MSAECEYILLKVVGEDSNNEIHFRVKTTTLLGKLKQSYSNRIGVPLTSLRFIYLGKKLGDDETPEKLLMKQDDVIDVHSNSDSADEKESITIQFINTDISITPIELDRTSPMRVPKRYVSMMTGVPMTSLKFVYQGKPLSDHETPTQLEMKGDVAIEVHLEEPTANNSSGESKCIKIKFIGQDSKEIHFCVKKTTLLGKVKKSYCDRVGVPTTSLRFLYHGKRLRDDETPDQLEMEDDDVIDVHPEQQDHQTSGESESIILKVVDRHSTEFHFRVKMTTLLGKLKTSFSTRVGLPVKSLRFCFNGRSIKDNETPEQLHMEPNSIIKVHRIIELIKLKLIDQHSNAKSYRAKVTTRLGKLKKLYSRKMGVPVTSLRFYFQGRRLHDTDTPERLGMRRVGVIRVYPHHSDYFVMSHDISVTMHLF